MSLVRRIGSVFIYSMIAGCGGETTAVSTTPVTTATVIAAASLQFQPGTVNLVQGGTVTFQFEGVQHNIFFDEEGEGAPDDIPQPTANASVARKFDAPGRWVYHCHIHPEMSGVVVVQ